MRLSYKYLLKRGWQGSKLDDIKAGRGLQMASRPATRFIKLCRHVDDNNRNCFPLGIRTPRAKEFGEEFGLRNRDVMQTGPMQPR